MQVQVHPGSSYILEQNPQKANLPPFPTPRTDSLDAEPSILQCNLLHIAHIFKSQNSARIPTVVSEISIIGKHCSSALFTHVFPVITENCPQYTPDLQVVLGTELLKIDMDHIPSWIGKDFCASAISIINQNRERNWANTRSQEIYGELLCRIVQLVKWSSEEHLDLLVFFDNIIGSSAPHLRQMAFNLLSAVGVSNIDEGTLNRHVVPRVWNSLPDVEPLVSGQGIKFLAKLPSRLSSNPINKRLWIEIVRIWKTDVKGSIQGKENALQAAVELVRNWYPGRTFDSNVLEAFYSSLFRWTMECCKKEMMGIGEEERELLRTIANAIGPLAKSVPQKSCRSCLDTFKDLSLCMDKNVREKCAKSLPAVSQLMEKGPAKAMTKIVQRLTRDTAKEVRMAIAEGFHVSMEHVLRSRNAPVHLQNLCLLLTDKDSNVQFKAMVNISATLETILGHRKSLTVFCRFAKEILCVTSQAPQTWRQRNQAVEQLGLSAKFIPASFLSSEVIPYLTALFMKDISSVRREAGKAFVRTMRCLGSVDIWNETVNRFCDTARSGPANRRLALVEALLFAEQEFSSSSFHDIFAPELYKLADDSVSNIRLKLASNLHVMASACQGDLQYAVVISKLSEDIDVNVKEEMDSFVERASKAVREAKQHSQKDVAKHQSELISPKQPSDPEDDGFSRRARNRRSINCLLPRLVRRAF